MALGSPGALIVIRWIAFALAPMVLSSCLLTLRPMANDIQLHRSQNSTQVGFVGGPSCVFVLPEEYILSIEKTSRSRASIEKGDYLDPESAYVVGRIRANAPGLDEQDEQRESEVYSIKNSYYTYRGARVGFTSVTAKATGRIIYGLKIATGDYDLFLVSSEKDSLPSVESILDPCAGGHSEFQSHGG
jgi:hypothetical protein